METVLRVILIYLFLIVGLRVIGKREFGQLSAQEFVILMIIPEMVSSALNQNDTSITNALVGTAAIFSLVFLTSTLSQRSRKFEALVSDSAAVLVHRGQPFADVMNKERVSPEEVMAEARKSGVERFDQIKWAVLESDGSIAIIPEDQDGGNDRPPRK